MVSAAPFQLPSLSSLLVETKAQEENQKGESDESVLF